MNKTDTLEADAPAIPKTWHLVGYYHKAESADECDFYFKDVINDDCPDCHPCYADTAALEKPAPAVPQEPVAWQYRGRPAVNREWGEWHTVGHKPKGPECTRFMMRPLFAAPQPQPRLTDAEILTLWAQTYVERGTSGIEFARAIEAAVMKKVTL